MPFLARELMKESSGYVMQLLVARGSKVLSCLKFVFGPANGIVLAERISLPVVLQCIEAFHFDAYLLSGKASFPSNPRLLSSLLCCNLIYPMSNTSLRFDYPTNSYHYSFSCE